VSPSPDADEGCSWERHRRRKCPGRHQNITSTWLLRYDSHQDRGYSQLVTNGSSPQVHSWFSLVGQWSTLRGRVAQQTE